MTQHATPISPVATGETEPLCEGVRVVRTNVAFPEDFDRQSPFVTHVTRRPLVAVIDSDHLIDGMSTSLLMEMVGHEDLLLIRSVVDGQPQIEIDDRPYGPLDAVEARVNTGRGVHVTAFPHAPQWQHFAEHPELKEGLELPPGPWQETTYRHQQYLLAAVARSMNVDLLVTDDPFLLGFRHPNPIGVNIVSSKDGIALSGSFLRQGEDYTYGRTSWSIRSLGRTMFYWVLASELMPTSQRIGSALSAHRQATGEQVIVTSAFPSNRLSQALRARDQIHWQIFRSHTKRSGEEILFYLDMLLLTLAATFDNVAGAVHDVLKLDRGKGPVSWNNETWCKSLSKAAPELASLMGPRAAPWLVFELITLLRNTIHESPLELMQYQRSQSDQLNVLQIPEAQVKRTRFLINQMGGEEAWGFQRIVDLYSWLDVGRLVEELMLRTIAALNALLGALPLDGLALPPDGRQESVFDVERDPYFNSDTKRRVRLLAGL